MDDAQWDYAMTEVASMHSARRLHRCFTSIMRFIQPGNPLAKNIKEGLSEDYSHQNQLLLSNIDVGLSDKFNNRALINIEDRLLYTGGDKLSTYGLFSTNSTGGHAIHTGVIQQTAYDVDSLQEYINENEPKLLEDQRNAFNTV